MHLAKKYLFIASTFCLLNTPASAQSLWKDTQSAFAARGASQLTESNERGVQNARALTLNTEAMKALLAPEPKANPLNARASNSLSIELPLPDGTNISLEIERTHILPSALANKYPTIKTYKVSEANGPIIAGRVDFTDQGFHAMLQTTSGKTLFIDPASQQSKTDDYLSYNKSAQISESVYQFAKPMGFSHKEIFAPQAQRIAARTRSNEGIIEYRLAVAATAEYTRLQGGTVSSALSAMVTTLNRVNHVYEQSLGIRLSLVENNDALIYSDSISDPYNNYNIERMLNENQSNIDRVIGSENYDIGHVFGTSGGGLAYIGSVCNASSKAKAASGIRNPNNDSFNIDYVAHEIGHQFGATHTFNSNQGICTSGARTSRSAFEPGSGSSIMSYVGGCGTDDLQTHADAMFHSGNIEQINQNVTSGSASACGVIHESNNTAPFVNAGNSYTIPANTPFELDGHAVDADNDELLYSWEQVDLGSASTIKEDTGDNPLFRILPPTTSSKRTFPSMSTLVGTDYVKGETLPTTDRNMTFQLAVYDGHHAPSLDRVNIQVLSNSTGFKLHSSASHYSQGSQFNLYWNTANTQNAPVNCPSLDLRISTDGGAHFDILLADGILNDGSASVFMPTTVASTNNGRFKLSCSNNIFFSVSSESFTVSQNANPASADPRNSSSAALAQDTSTSGGGSIGLPLILLMLVVFVFKNKSKRD